MSARHVLPLALAAAGLAGCGASVHSKPLPTVLPPPAPVTPTMRAAGTDPRGDAGDPAADIVSARIEQRNGHLVATVVLAADPRSARGTLDVGAYLLATEGDDSPEALHARVPRTGAVRYALGPYLGKGRAVTGTITGATVTIDGGVVAQGRWRYVQFYAESDAGDDVLPDTSSTATDKIPLTGVGAS